MRRWIVYIAMVTLAAVVLSARAYAQQYPNVATIPPFSAQANFMSLPGYLRYLVHQQTSQWLTYEEASRIVQQEKGQ